VRVVGVPADARCGCRRRELSRTTNAPIATAATATPTISAATGDTADSASAASAKTTSSTTMPARAPDTPVVLAAAACPVGFASGLDACAAGGGGVTPANTLGGFTVTELLPSALYIGHLSHSKPDLHRLLRAGGLPPSSRCKAIAASLRTTSISPAGDGLATYARCRKP